MAKGVVHLNHGSFGATPLTVLAASDRWRAQMDADPTTFFNRDLPGLLRDTAARVAGLLGGRGEDWAFVENATAGINALVGSVELSPGDEVICLSQVYGAVGNVLRHHTARSGARIVVVPVPVPFVDPAPLLDRLRRAITPHTRLASFDHVTSQGATVMPISDMAAICRAAGVPVAIDGAHAPGMLALDVPAMGVDWYVGNLHKWCFAPRGTGVIWCAPQRQGQLHPVAISHYYGQGFTSEFDYGGTRDNSAWLAAAAGIDYLESLGVERMRAHNHALTRQAGEMLASAWHTEVSAAPEFLGSMAAVRLPDGGGGNRRHARDLAIRLTQEYGITCAVVELAGALWLRVSAQVYNEANDYERLASLGATLCRGLTAAPAP